MSRRHLPRFRHLLAPVLAPLLAAGCPGCADDGGGASSRSQPSASVLFGPDVTRVVLEVDYQTGGDPFTGSAGPIRDTWKIFSDNTERMFAAGDKEIDFPSTLGEMEELTGVLGDTFTTRQILDIAARHRDELSSRDSAAFYALWLNGMFVDGGEVQTDILGVSIGDAGVIAVFKPVVRRATPIGTIARFVEQTTLVHEFGHAVGLVNRGIPLTSEHQDVEHGFHCTNQDCVMYFTNEIPAKLCEFVARFMESGSTVVFGVECLDDMDALGGGGPAMGQ